MRMPSALVTGGSSGIGLAIASMLREEGYDLTLSARTLERLREAGARLGCTVVQADVSREEDCARLVAEHLERHGGMNVLVNSAGVGIAGPVGEMETKKWDLQQSVNVRGAFLVTREALPALRTTRGYERFLEWGKNLLGRAGIATFDSPEDLAGFYAGGLLFDRFETPEARLATRSGA
jgi:NAD(P)-dependent dehydrogenase (short-subunit alcohol dehydrogenase family)